MASSAKQDTTMVKLNRERKLRERRLDKQAKQDARKHASVHQQGHSGEGLTGVDDQSSHGHRTARSRHEPTSDAGVVRALHPACASRRSRRSRRMAGVR
jgi:hypothetical protein